MIQLITGDKQKQNEYQKISDFVISDFGKPKSFDEYDVNVIDLSFNSLWRNNDNSTNNINLISDLVHYKKVIETTNVSNVVVLFPQNIMYRYWLWNGKYSNEKQLKNLLNLVEVLIEKNINEYAFTLNFEETVTNIKGENVEADFYFDKASILKDMLVTQSNKANKITTIRIKPNLYYTTLKLSENPEKLMIFLEENNILAKGKITVPSWFDDINILDDVVNKNNIKEIDSKIAELYNSKDRLLKKLEENNEIKSILYETDKELQNKVIKILKEIFEYEDDDFIDEMEEDFRVKKEDVTFIIETKGLSKNVKGTDVNKAQGHVLMYEEKLHEEEKLENVKGIFVVAIQREKNPAEREKLADRQVTLAKINDILIIRVEELLKLFEGYRKKEITTKEIIEQLKNQTGEYKYSK